MSIQTVNLGTYANDGTGDDLRAAFEKVIGNFDYLDIVKTPHSETFDRPSLLNDFKQFYTQYDTRRNKNFTQTFPALADWYTTL